MFHSVPDLVASIQEYIDAHNNDPKPYVWTATAESILAKVSRGRITLEKNQRNNSRSTTKNSSRIYRCRQVLARTPSSSAPLSPRPMASSFSEI